MLRADTACAADMLNNRVTDAIARHRRLLFVLIGLLYVAAFSGRWRVGLDSANYRGLALNIVRGNGYTFGDWAPKQIYPGLPYVFAGIEWMLGPADRSPGDAEQLRLLGPSLPTTGCVLFILSTAVLTLIFTYRLIRLHYPTWVAVTVTCGVGSNSVFLEQSQELLTDMPFLMGVVASLYGWDLLQRSQVPKQKIRAGLLLAVGLVVAASMRPMFWVLALCWVATCIWGLIRKGQRRFFALSLLTLLLIWTLLMALDPRVKGFHPLQGGYEREALQLLPEVPSRVYRQLHHILHDQLPRAVFGERLAPVSIEGSLVVLGSTLLLWRRHALWVLLALGTFFVTVLLSAEPRYYLMVLPILMLGLLAMLCALARRVPRFWGQAILVGGLLIVVANNFTASIHLFVEQHHANFIEYYKHGSYVPVLKMCQILRQHVRPDHKVLGPSGAIMSVLSGVHVYTQREVLPRPDQPDAPAMVASAGFDYAVFPGSCYRDKEPVIARMMDLRIISATNVIATIGQEMYLAVPRIALPPGEWWNPPPNWRPPPIIKRAKPHPAATRPVRRKRRPASQPVATYPASAPMQPEDRRSP